MIIYNIYIFLVFFFLKKMEQKYKYDDFARKGIYLYLYLWNIVREIMVIIKVLIIYIFYISIVILRFVLNGNSDWLFLRIRIDRRDSMAT